MSAGQRSVSELNSEVFYSPDEFNTLQLTCWHYPAVSVEHYPNGKVKYRQIVKTKHGMIQAHWWSDDKCNEKQIMTPAVSEYLMKKRSRKSKTRKNNNEKNYTC